MIVEYTIDIPSSANLRGAVKARISRVKRQRERAYWTLFAAERNGAKLPEKPYTVTITRISKRKITDAHDNLRYACKPTADGIAQFLKVDDGDISLVNWEYKQETNLRGKVVSETTVRIEIEHRKPAVDHMAVIREAIRLIELGAPGNAVLPGLYEALGETHPPRTWP